MIRIIIFLGIYMGAPYLWKLPCEAKMTGRELRWTHNHKAPKSLKAETSVDPKPQTINPK